MSAGTINSSTSPRRRWAPGRSQPCTGPGNVPGPRRAQASTAQSLLASPGARTGRSRRPNRSTTRPLGSAAARRATVSSRVASGGPWRPRFATSWPTTNRCPPGRSTSPSRVSSDVRSTVGRCRLATMTRSYAVAGGRQVTTSACTVCRRSPAAAARATAWRNATAELSSAVTSQPLPASHRLLRPGPLATSRARPGGSGPTSSTSSGSGVLIHSFSANRRSHNCSSSPAMRSPVVNRQSRTSISEPVRPGVTRHTRRGRSPSSNGSTSNVFEPKAARRATGRRSAPRTADNATKSSVLSAMQNSICEQTASTESLGIGSGSRSSPGGVERALPVTAAGDCLSTWCRSRRKVWRCVPDGTPGGTIRQTVTQVESGVTEALYAVLSGATRYPAG